MISSFIINNMNQDQPNEEMHRVRSERVLGMKLLCPLPRESECPTLLADSCIPQPVSSSEPWILEVCFCFFPILLCSHSWLNPWSCDWTPSLWPSSPWRLAAISCLKPKYSNYMIDLSGITSAWFKIISLAQTQLWSKGSNWGNSYNRKFQEFRSSVLESWDKDQESFFFFVKLIVSINVLVFC